MYQRPGDRCDLDQTVATVSPPLAAQQLLRRALLRPHDATQRIDLTPHPGCALNGYAKVKAHSIWCTCVLRVQDMDMRAGRKSKSNAFMKIKRGVKNSGESDRCCHFYLTAVLLILSTAVLSVSDVSSVPYVLYFLSVP